MPTHGDGFFEGSTAAKLENLAEKIDELKDDIRQGFIKQDERIAHNAHRITKLESARIFASGGRAMLVLIGGLVAEGLHLLVEWARHK